MINFKKIPEKLTFNLSESEKGNVAQADLTAYST